MGEYKSLVVRLGSGQGGSTLSPSSVFLVANNLASLVIDEYTLSKLPSSNSSSTTSGSSQSSFSVPDYLTYEEARASILVFLNKLLLSSSSTPSAGPTSAVVAQLYDANALDLNNVILHNRSFKIQDAFSPSNLDYDVATVSAISALLDHISSSLASIVDGIAALTCEALRANVSGFDLTDSGDGSSIKDKVAVAADLKVFLTNSKLVQNKKLVDISISGIPAAHGSFREKCRLLHSNARVQLSTPFKTGSETALDISATLSSLAVALLNLAELSCNRVELLANVIPDGDELRAHVGAQRPVTIGWFKQTYRSSQDALIEKDYVGFSHNIFLLLEGVRKAVSWEATLAYLLLEGSSSGLVTTNEGNALANADIKKNEKKRKVLGTGSAALVQFIKESILDGAITEENPIKGSALLENWYQDFLSSFNPAKPKFELLLKKVKEIVESNESRRVPKLPKGTRDFAKEQMAVREKAFAIIVDVFKRHGATALDTPAFELRETLMGKYGEDSKLIYDLADQGGELCSLRYDLTVPFARFVAQNKLTSFKRYQIAKVYRRDNPSKGRYREFYQCDFDIAGKYDKMGPDFEVIKILTELLNELNIGDYEVKLNHRKLLDGMMAICGVPPEKFRTVCSSIDKLDKQPFEQIKKEMVNEKGLTEETADALGTFVKKRGSPMEMLYELKQEGSKFLENAESLLALNELDILFKALQKANCDHKVVFDLSLARGLDYYTGVIFEVVFKGATQVGSIAAGGRYDNLIGMFGKDQIPAVGISLGIERVFAIMEQLQKDRNEAIRPNETQVLVSILSDDLSLAAELVSELWDAKVKAEYMLDKRLMKHIGRAKDSRIPFMVIVGENELKEGKVRLKDVAAAIDTDVPRSSFVEEIRLRLNAAPN
ncbi:OLC1v1031777C3 [Oldenlandia corymbosa var. corymbosa]|uniref:Histidine--tRNA ligase, cytoplasmic n=1 Tax=Oldenlandia corymbosa var. corymbosa TaxID=529605 RepID=A0AAV1CM70_OLDCO|nr:OLC1v1031777C3 [Oldenlandia corymbosa var. corymbosa]